MVKCLFLKAECSPIHFLAQHYIIQSIREHELLNISKPRIYDPTLKVNAHQLFANDNEASKSEVSIEIRIHIYNKKINNQTNDIIPRGFLISGHS